LQKQRVLVPEHRPPRRNAHGQPDIHPKQHPQKQLCPFQPVRQPMRPVPSSRCTRPRLRPLPGRRSHKPPPRLGSRARGQRRRYHFRLLGHAVGSRAAPDSAQIAGIRRRPGSPGPAQGRRIATVSQQALSPDDLWSLQALSSARSMAAIRAASQACPPIPRHPQLRHVTLC